MKKRSDNIGAEQATLRETFQSHLRACREMRDYCPGIFLSTALHSVVSALSPCVAVYLSARIINELAGQKRQQVLGELVLAALGSAFALTVFTGLLLRLKEYMYSKWDARKEHIFADKMLSMDFADVDAAKSHDLLSRIRQNWNWGGWGFQMLISCFAELIRGLAGVLGAAALAVSLFTRPVPESAGELSGPNYTAFLLGVIAILGLAAGGGALPF